MKMTKRGFLAGAAASAAAAALTRRAAPEPTRGEPPASPAFDAVVFNERYSDARAFAQTLGAQGVLMLPIAGDAGALWYRVLRKQVESGRRRLAGLGTSIDLLILESLGREARLRLCFQAQHDARGRSTLTHSIRMEDARRALLDEELTSSDWPARLATALPRMANLRGGAAASVVVTDVPPSDDHPGMLVSWVLADRHSSWENV
jgi:hypothetical protein